MSELLRRYQEWRADSQARKEFSTWQITHPKEAQILELIDDENRHALAVQNNTRRAELLESVREKRRNLGLRDELIDYAVGNIHRVERLLAEEPGFIHSPEEMALLQEVNHGFLLRSGSLTPGLGRPLTK